MDRSDKAIQDLCISYSSYMRAITDQKAHAIAVWAKCLLDDQASTGVEMVPNDRLKNTIHLYKSILAEAY